MNRTAKHMYQRILALLTALVLLPVCALGEGGGTVGGCAYVDADGSLSCTEGEQLITGLPVQLYLNEDGSWQQIAQTETDEYGYYAFDGLAAGEYCVRSSTTSADYTVLAVGDSAQPTGTAGEMRSASLTVQAGESHTADVALGQAAGLELTVYEDRNVDGKMGQYDEGVKGVTVELMDGDTVIASGETAKKGKLTFEGVIPGTYTICITVPEGYGFCVKGENYEKGDSIVGASGSRVSESDPFLFTAGETLSLGAGVMAVGTFSGKVFEDADNNGIMDETDPGVAGVALKLQGKKTGNVFEMTSSEDGTYFFDLLPADTYIFTAELPEGMMYARYSKDGGDLRSVFTGETLEREFPVSAKKRQTDKNVGVIQNGTVSGMAFFDMDYDGLWDEDEPGYTGVSIEVTKFSNGDSAGKMTTGEDGSFAIGALRSSDYRIRAVLPEDGSSFSRLPLEDGVEGNQFVSANRVGTLDRVSVVSGAEVKLLVGVVKGASIQGTLFEDANYNGVLDKGERTFSGVQVQLVDEDGNVAAKTSSVAKGFYELTGIMPGTYTLRVQRTRNNGFTRLRPAEKGGSYIRELIDGYGVSDPMEIAMAQELTGINAGMLPAGTVSGILFHDANDNGLQDEGEYGLTTATVRLQSADGEIVLTRSVAEDGAYLFDGVMPGDYTLTFQLPEHTEIAQVVSGGNTLTHGGQETVTDSFAVAMGQEVAYPLVGAVTLGSYEGVAFHDNNANGLQDEGEQPLSGVTVMLSSGAGEYQTASAQDGSFTLTELRPADYQLTLTLPDGYISAADTATLTLQPLKEQTVACPWTVLTDRQSNLIGGVQPASISGEIRLDENNNGQSESTERMMTGISLELTDENSGDSQSVQSDENGFVFASVRPGTYTVRFVLPQQAEPAQIVGSTFTFGGDAMEQTGVTVTEGQQLTGLSTALVSRTSIGGALSLYDEAGQQPVAGVKVTLLDNASGNEVASTVSDESGAYRFDGLWPGDYRIHADLADNAIFVRPDDANYPQGASIILNDDGDSGVITLKMAQHRLSENILYIRTAKVGDLAWLDENGNGLLDGSERRLPGVKVQLVQNGQTVYETETDLQGYYQFANVYPGTYTLYAQAYPELAITRQVPALRIISSCLISGDGQNAQSEAFTVESGSITNDFDLGYVLLPGQQLPQLPDAPTRDWSTWNTQYTSMQKW